MVLVNVKEQNKPRFMLLFLYVKQIVSNAKMAASTPSLVDANGRLWSKSGTKNSGL